MIRPIESEKLDNLNSIMKKIVSYVKIMGSMFYVAISFNQPLNEWKMTKNVYLNKMFYRAISFDQPLDKWDVSNVTDMDSMFYNARSFNQSLEKWDVSNVTEIDLN